MNHFRVRVLDHSRKVVFERVIDKFPSPSTEIARPVLLAQTDALPVGENQPLTLRLPPNVLSDAPARFRVSAATRLRDVVLEEKRLADMNNADIATRLALAYALNGRISWALSHFSTAIRRAHGYEARKPIIETAARSHEVFSALITRQPDDPQFQLALARRLAGQGKERLADKQRAQAQAELEKAHEIFVRLREKDPQPEWTL
jgi:hypothetical protein